MSHIASYVTDDAIAAIHRYYTPRHHILGSPHSPTRREPCAEEAVYRVVLVERPEGQQGSVRRCLSARPGTGDQPGSGRSAWRQGGGSVKSYSVLQSTTYGEWVKVEAKNEGEAIKKVESGDYYDEDIISSKLIIRETTGDIEEEA